MKPTGLLHQTLVCVDANLGLCDRGKTMEGLTDTAAFATKLKNTLIQYHTIEDDKWRVAKKTVN